MTDPYRVLCAELVELCTPVDSIPQLAERLQKLNALADRARALLAEAEAEGPTDEELDRMERKYWKLGSSIEIEPEGIREVWDREETFDHRAFARAALARWGRPAAAPVAMIELITDMSMHLAHMQELLEDCEYGDPEDYHWYRESVRLRAVAAEALA